MTRFKWTKRMLVVITSGAALLYCADKMGDSEYERNKAQKTTLRQGVEALYTNPKEAQKYFTREALDELADELHEAGKYRLVHIEPLYTLPTGNPNTKFIHLRIERIDKETNERQTRYMTPEVDIEGRIHGK